MVTRAVPVLVVSSLVRQSHPQGVLVYNLEVEGDHTYFVGTADGGVWVHNSCIADAIANGHAFTKHVLNLGEFRGLEIRTVKQFSEHTADVMKNGTVRSLARGRTAYWKDGTFVVHDPASSDLGSALQPIDGIAYFLKQR